MKKIIFIAAAAALACSISACSNTGYTKVQDKNGTVVTHGHVNKGTTVISDGQGGYTIDANKGPEQQFQVPTDPVQ